MPNIIIGKDGVFQNGFFGSSPNSFTFTSSAYSGVSFNTSNEDNSPYDIHFRNDGLKAYMIPGGNAVAYEYDFSTAYDLATISYSGNSLDANSQVANPVSISVQSNGNKAYIASFNNDTIYSYDLSSSWDLSTGSYSGNSLSVVSQSPQLRSIFFKSDGSKLYTGGLSNKVVEWNLSTAWDITSASYSGKSFDVSARQSSLRSIEFEPSGTAFYTSGTGPDRVDKFNLTTGWDVSTASYSGTSLNVSSQSSFPFGVGFDNVGNKMYIVEAVGGFFYEYDLS
jgi:hypothetical protein